MDDLVAHIVAQTGVGPVVARKAAISILEFLRREGPADKVKTLVDALGAGAALGPIAGSSGGVMGVFNELTAAGLRLGDIQAVARAFIGFARTKAGVATVDAVVGAIPGLGQFV